jgi:hypothetical protein
MNGPTNRFCISCGKPLFAGAGGPPSPTPYPSAGPPGGPAFAPYPYLPGPPPRRATVGPILSGTLDVWTKNSANFFVVFFLLALVNGLLGGLLALEIYGTFEIGASPFPGGPPTGIPAGALINILLYALFTVLAGAVLNSIVAGGMTEYAVRKFRQEPITLEDALRRGFNRFLSILGANALITLLILALVFVPILVIVLPFLGGGPVNVASALGVICGGLTLLAVGGVVALYIGIATILYAPLIMMENANAIGGLRRSWRLTKGHWWSLFAAFLIVVILAGILTGAITAPIGYLHSSIANLLAMSIAAGIVGAWTVVVASVAYDLITRQRSGPSPYYPPAPTPPVGAAQLPKPPPAAPPPPSGP